MFPGVWLTVGDSIGISRQRPYGSRLRFYAKHVSEAKLTPH